MNDLIRGLIVALAFVLFAVSACGGGDGDDSELVTDYPYSIQTFDELGRDHFAAGQVYNNYNSNPPTTGPHASAFDQWGIYEEPQPKEMMVHNMEHAGVIVWYNCEAASNPLTADACAQLKNNLAAIVQPEIASGTKIVMTPYANMPNHIALTAWRHLDTFDDFDGQRVQTFIDTFECRFDPEHFC